MEVAAATHSKGRFGRLIVSLKKKG